MGTPLGVYERPVDLAAARLTGPASVIDDPCGGGRGLGRPGWACLGGPRGGQLTAVRFQGPHTAHVVRSRLGTVLLREPGPHRHADGDHVTWSLLRSWPLPGSAEDARDG